MVLADGDTIGRSDWPPEILEGVRRGPVSAVTNRLTAGSLAGDLIPSRSGATDRLNDELADLERDRLISALAACGGNKAQAARQLGMPRTTLFSKLRRHGLE